MLAEVSQKGREANEPLHASQPGAGVGGGVGGSGPSRMPEVTPAREVSSPAPLCSQQSPLAEPLSWKVHATHALVVLQKVQQASGEAKPPLWAMSSPLPRTLFTTLWHC